MHVSVVLCVIGVLGVCSVAADLRTSITSISSRKLLQCSFLRPLTGRLCECLGTCAHPCTGTFDSSKQLPPRFFLQNGCSSTNQVTLRVAGASGSEQLYTVNPGEEKEVFGVSFNSVGDFKGSLQYKTGSGGAWKGMEWQAVNNDCSTSCAPCAYEFQKVVACS